MPRRPLRPALALLAGLCALAACATSPPIPRPLADACRPVRRVELPLRDARNFMLAAALLDGKPATLLVDTGAETSTLAPRTVAALHLRRDPAHGRTLAGVTGNVRSDTVRLRQLALGGVVVAGAQDMAVGTLPSLEGLDPPVAGLLGGDVLSRFEVDLDLPAGRMTPIRAAPVRLSALAGRARRCCSSRRGRASRCSARRWTDGRCARCSTPAPAPRC